MKVIIDIEKSENPYCGLGQYTLKLIEHLSKVNIEKDYNFQLLFVSHGHPLEKKEVYLKNHHVKFLGYEKALDIYKNDLQNTIWHAPFQDPKHLPKNGKIIVTVHDLNFLYELSFWPKRFLKKREVNSNLKNAKEIVSISHFTKNELIKYLKIREERIQVIYSGPSLNKEISPVRPQKLNSEKKFFLSIGVNVKKKNFLSLIYMIEYIQDTILVIAGSDDTSYSKLMKSVVEELNLKEKVFIIGRITDGEKNWLLENCQAFLFPSLLEGFGLPVAEAMSFSKPIMISDKTSLPEIAGENAGIWTDTRPELMAKKLQEYLHEIDLNPHILSKIYERSKRYDWHQTSLSYLELYKKLLSKSLND